jgi:uncharacterized protein (DUF1330 family)
MIYITQLIYLIEGRESIFDEFESVAIPIISKYKGKLLFRVRPDAQAFIESQIDKPYEIHLVQFETERDFESFMQEDERKKFIHLKEQAIQSSILYKGKKM